MSDELIGNIKDIVLIIGTIIGAVWAITIRKFYKAKLEINELELKVRTQSVISIQINISQDSDFEGNSFLIINVEISNQGNENAVLNHSKEPISICKVYLNDNVMQFGKVSKYHDIMPGKSFDKPQVVRPNSVLNISRIHKIPEKGLYAVSYSAHISKRDYDIMKKDFELNEEELKSDFYMWKKTEYYNVKEITNHNNV